MWQTVSGWRLPRVLVAGAMAVGALVLPGPPLAAAASDPPPLMLPFAAGQQWEVQRGYFQGSGSLHHQRFELDLTYPYVPGPGRDHEGAGDEIVYAPWRGSVAWHAGNVLCINLDQQSGGQWSIHLGHFSPDSDERSNGASVTRGERIGRVFRAGEAGSGNNGIAHLHLEVFSTRGCPSGTEVAFAGAAQFQCGPNLYDTGQRYGDTTNGQWVETKIARDSDQVARAGTPFWDICNSSFDDEIFWAWDTGITGGCDDGDRFCPLKSVRRDEMASFLARYLDLPPASEDYFSDDATSSHQPDINRIAEAGITSGCGGGKYCPSRNITRAEMAAFLVRAFNLPAASSDYFTDDESSPYEAQINALAKSGITGGCATGRFCPNSPVTREQMVTFLYRHAHP